MRERDYGRAVSMNAARIDRINYGPAVERAAHNEIINTRTRSGERDGEWNETLMRGKRG